MRAGSLLKTAAKLGMRGDVLQARFALLNARVWNVECQDSLVAAIREGPSAAVWCRTFGILPMPNYASGYGNVWE